MDQLGSITQNTKTETHGQLTIPADPWMFGHTIQYAQDRKHLDSRHRILFNKGRYFETTIPNETLRNRIAQELELKVQHENMIVASWAQMEAFVIAMNKSGFYVTIQTDWI